MLPHQEDFKRITNKTVSVVGVSVANAHIVQGMEDAPSKFREGGLFKAVGELGWIIEDTGDVTRSKLESWVKEDDQISGRSKNTDFKVMNAEIISSMNNRIQNQQYENAKKGSFCLTIGGDQGLT